MNLILPNTIIMKTIYVFIFCIISSSLIFFSCLSEGICDHPPIPWTTVLVSLLEEDSNQSLIGDVFSGGIYNSDEIRVYFNDTIKRNAIINFRSIGVDDWPDPIPTDQLLALDYLIDLPDESFVSGFDRDTLRIEYMAREPENDCSFDSPNTGNVKELNFLRVIYNGVTHYEDGPFSSAIAVRLDRI